jgi:hypothetical protein
MKRLLGENTVDAELAGALRAGNVGENDGHRRGIRGVRAVLRLTLVV